MTLTRSQDASAAAPEPVASYARLRRENEWGVRVTWAVRAGDRVLVERRDGRKHHEVVKAVVCRGRGYTLCSIYRKGEAPPAPVGAGPDAPATVDRPRPAPAFKEPEWPTCGRCGVKQVGLYGVTPVTCRKCELSAAFDRAVADGEAAAEKRALLIDEAFATGARGEREPPAPPGGSLCASDLGLRPGDFPPTLTVAGALYVRGAAVMSGEGEVEHVTYRSASGGAYLNVYND